MVWPFSSSAKPSSSAPSMQTLSYQSSHIDAPGGQLGLPGGTNAASGPQKTRKQIQLEKKENAIKVKSAAYQQAADETQEKLIEAITTVIRTESSAENKTFQKVYDDQSSFHKDFEVFLKMLEAEGFKMPALCNERSFRRSFLHRIYKSLLETEVISSSHAQSANVLDRVINGAVVFSHPQVPVGAPQPASFTRTVQPTAIFRHGPTQLSHPAPPTKRAAVDDLPQPATKRQTLVQQELGFDVIDDDAVHEDRCQIFSSSPRSAGFAGGQLGLPASLPAATTVQDEDNEDSITIHPAPRPTIPASTNHYHV